MYLRTFVQMGSHVKGVKIQKPMNLARMAEKCRNGKFLPFYSWFFISVLYKLLTTYGKLYIWLVLRTMDTKNISVEISYKSMY